jgi:hypothetical protein
MKLRSKPAALLAALAAAVALVSACGAESHSEVVEGEPLELGGLNYNIAITRFLNPDDVEDAEYLEGEPAPPPGKEYLGVFLTIRNETDEDLASADSYTVVDTTGAEYEPVETQSSYALDIGTTVPAEGRVPEPGSTAAAGAIQGAMLLFLVDQEVSENRPLELEIESDGEEGLVELDI